MALPASGLIKSPKTLFSRLLPCLTNWITGLYPEACRDWDKKAANFKKTWPFFKTFFPAANRDLRLMQTTSKQAGFDTEHGLSIRQHNDHRPESDNNIEAQGIAYIITDLAQSISEDKETIKSALTDMTVTIKSLQEKIETMKKRADHENAIIIIKVIAGLTVGLGKTTTPALLVTINRLGIKMMQPLPHLKEVLTNIAMIPDECGALF